MNEDGKIKKEIIDKDKLPTDTHHPGEEVSDENKIILGDEIEGVEPSPAPAAPGKKNYVLIILVIVIAVIAIFWGVKGCHSRSVIDSTIVSQAEYSSVMTQYGFLPEKQVHLFTEVY